MLRSIIISSEGIEEMMSEAPATCVGRHLVRSLTEMQAVLAETQPGDHPVTLDLLGHSTRDTRLLRMGKTIVDVADARVAAFFDRLKIHITRLQINEVRLLGCETAVEVVGQRTIRVLARMLGVRVFGTRKRLMKTHYNADGFDPVFSAALIESAQLPNPPCRL
jgi:hypothetical protein